MSTIFAADEELLSGYDQGAMNPSDVDEFLRSLDNWEMPEIDLPPLASPGTNNNQPNNGDNVSDALVIDGVSPFHHPAAVSSSNPLLQDIIKPFLGSSDEEPIALPPPPAVHENSNGFLVPPLAVVVQPPPQNNHLLLQAIVHSRPPRVYNNTGFHQNPMIMSAGTTSNNVNEGGFGYRESYGNPFPPPPMQSGGLMVNHDQYSFHRDRVVSLSNPRINDQHAYSSYDLHDHANSIHAMNAPAARPASSSAPDHMRFTMPNINYSSDQPPEMSPLPSTSHIAFAGTQGGQHINDIITAPTENSLVLQNGSPPQEWVWDFDESYNMEVVEDATPLQIIDSSLSNGGAEDKKMKKKKQVVRWTVEEHLAMLAGIKKYGKGNWKIISREFANSKSPIQIASHYQKYDIRQKGNEETKGTSVEHKRKKRKSIHDITIYNLGTSNGTAI